jgi:hypothetical protein
MHRARPTNALHYTNFNLRLEACQIRSSLFRLSLQIQKWAPTVETTSVHPSICYPSSATNILSCFHKIRYRTSLQKSVHQPQIHMSKLRPSDNCTLLDTANQYQSILSMFIDRFGRNLVQETPTCNCEITGF